MSRLHVPYGIADKYMVLWGSALADAINQFKYAQLSFLLVVKLTNIMALDSNHFHVSGNNISIWQDDAIPDPVGTALPTWN